MGVEVGAPEQATLVGQRFEPQQRGHPLALGAAHHAAGEIRHGRVARWEHRGSVPVAPDGTAPSETARFPTVDAVGHPV
ncbi:hypothetical protein GCM10009610_02960 [Pseudonocardia xinjiangensis]